MTLPTEPKVRFPEGSLARLLPVITLTAKGGRAGLFYLCAQNSLWSVTGFWSPNCCLGLHNIAVILPAHTSLPNSRTSCSTGPPQPTPSQSPCTPLPLRALRPSLSPAQRPPAEKTQPATERAAEGRETAARQSHRHAPKPLPAASKMAAGARPLSRAPPGRGGRAGGAAPGQRGACAPPSGRAGPGARCRRRGIASSW